MSLTRLFQNKAFIFSICFILLALAVFWSDRYPALLHKADVMGEIELQDRLSPDAGYAQNAAERSFVDRTVTTFGNWAYTNKKGMTFGLVFGAAVLTLMGFARPSQSGTNPYANALKGALTGTPLGVCSNCVAPIARGFFKSGMPATFALAVMFASPTFNIIVVSMTFSAFPPAVALIKILANLTLIMVVVPLLYKFLMKNDYARAKTESCDTTPYGNAGSTPETAPVPHPYLDKLLWFIVSRILPLIVIGSILGAALAENIPLESLLIVALLLYKLPIKNHSKVKAILCRFWKNDSALKGLPPQDAILLFTRRYLDNLWFIVSRTLPLMVIGGILGSALAQGVPLENITSGSSVWTLGVLSLVSTFMPVPITFDVLTAQILYNAGTGLPMVLTVLTTMGTFSILSCLIVWQSVGTRMALALFLSVALLGFISGLLGMMLI